MFIKNLLMGIFLIVQILLGLVFTALASFLVHSKAFPFAYLFMPFALFFLVIGLGGFLAGSRWATKLWLYLTTIHFLTQVRLVVLSVTSLQVAGSCSALFTHCRSN